MSINENLVKNANAKSVKSRIALKIDTWDNWQKDAAKSLVLHAGEVAFVQMGTVPPIGTDKPANGAYDVLFKVGDGTSAFKDLPWGSAKAADVYDWAKVSSANSVEISYGSGENAKKSTLSEFLQAFETYKTSNDQAISGINGTLQTLSGKVEGLEGLVGGDANFATKDDVSKAVGDAKKELVGSSNTTGVVSTIKEASAQAIAAQSTADEAKTKATENAEEIATLKTKVNTDLEGRVAALEADDTTKTYVDEELKKKVDTSTYNAKMQAIDAKDSEQDGKLITLIGSDTGKSARTIAAEETAKIVAGADAAYDTLKEVADWIKSDTTGAAKMNSDIADNAAAIEVLNGDVNTAGSVAKAVADEATARARAITNAIDALDMTELSVGAGETIKTVKQADGKVSATKQTISITKSQIPDFKDSDYATADHNHDDKYASKAAFDEHVTKAVTTETYVLFDCGSSTVNVD